MPREVIEFEVTGYRAVGVAGSTRDEGPWRRFRAEADLDLRTFAKAADYEELFVDCRVGEPERVEEDESDA